MTSIVYWKKSKRETELQKIRRHCCTQLFAFFWSWINRVPSRPECISICALKSDRVLCGYAYRIRMDNIIKCLGLKCLLSRGSETLRCPLKKTGRRRCFAFMAALFPHRPIRHRFVREKFYEFLNSFRIGLNFFDDVYGSPLENLWMFSIFWHFYCSIKPKGETFKFWKLMGIYVVKNGSKSVLLWIYNNNLRLWQIKL